MSAIETVGADRIAATDTETSFFYGSSLLNRTYAGRLSLANQVVADRWERSTFMSTLSCEWV